MTQTPETKTPTRAEALVALEFLCGKINGYQNAKDILKTALSATDAPIVEGLEEAIEWCEYAIDNGFLFDNHAKSVLEAARLYAQGRTQSAVPEKNCSPNVDRGIDAGESLRRTNANGGEDEAKVLVEAVGSAVPEALRTLDWERDLDLLRAEVVNDVVATLRIDRLHQLIEALSAAPPVTGGAWLPIETCPKNGDEFIVLIIHQEKTKSFLKAGEEQEYRELHLTYTAIWDKQFENIMVYKNPGASYGYRSLDPEDIDGWMALPAPPSSADKEGV